MNKNYIKYCLFLLLSFILTTIGSGLGTVLNINFMGLLVGSIVIFVIFLLSKGIFKQIMFIIFCLGEGLCLSPIVQYYSNTSLLLCIGIAALITVICMIIGLLVKDLSFLGNVLFIGLTIIIVYSVIGLFVTLPSIAWIIIIIFSLYICYDMNNFKQEARYRELSNEEILDHVINMYLDILNILLELIKIFGGCDDN